MRAQISYDLIMEEEMSFVEGTFRLPGCEWQVFIFGRGAVTSPEININVRWQSGVSGIFVKWPREWTLNKAGVVRVLSERFGITDWEEVRGPDSMRLR
jgi:hypothetical protein